MENFGKENLHLKTGKKRNKLQNKSTGHKVYMAGEEHE